jgi:DNA mismatch endonuclease, patch repair protein
LALTDRGSIARNEHPPPWFHVAKWDDQGIDPGTCLKVEPAGALGRVLRTKWEHARLQSTFRNSQYGQPMPLLRPRLAPKRSVQLTTVNACAGRERRDSNGANRVRTSRFRRAIFSVCAMVDTRTPQQRRRIMQSVKTKNTGPELVVRRTAHALGYRYRLHRNSLPGKPDIVFPILRKAIFVHGCFWHGHSCDKGRPPKSRAEYWLPKIKGNKARDASAVAALHELGWKTLTIWQCQTIEPRVLQKIVVDFLGRRKRKRRLRSNV